MNISYFSEKNTELFKKLDERKPKILVDSSVKLAFNIVKGMNMLGAVAGTLYGLNTGVKEVLMPHLGQQGIVLYGVGAAVIASFGALGIKSVIGHFMDQKMDVLLNEEEQQKFLYYAQQLPQQSYLKISQWSGFGQQDLKLVEKLAKSLKP